MDQSSLNNMSESEIIEWFQDFKHMPIYQRIALFHKLGLRKAWQTQDDAIKIMGLRSRSSLAQFDALKNRLSMHCSWPSILDAWSEGQLYDAGGKIDFTTLDKKLKKGRQIECVYQEGERWHLRWKEQSIR